jgi:hypothetical protein
MRNVPVDPAKIYTLTGVMPHIKEGVQQFTKEGEPVLTVSVLIPPTATERQDTGEIRVPASGVPKDMPPKCQVRFDNLLASAWAMNGSKGLSLKATAVHVVTSVPKAAS